MTEGGQQILQADNRASLLARFHYIIHSLARVVGARWCEMSSEVLIEVKSIRRLFRDEKKALGTPLWTLWTDRHVPLYN